MPSLRCSLDSESAYFAYRWRHHPTPRPSMTPLPHPSTIHDAIAPPLDYPWRHRPTPRPLMMPSPHPLTSSLWPLHPATSHNNCNNFVLQKILSLSGLLGQNIMLLCHYAEQKRIMDNRICHIILEPPRRGSFFYCLFVYSRGHQPF